MRYLLIALLLFTGCTNTQRINRQLRLSKLHLLKAQSLGAVMDSTKTVKHDSAEVSGIHDDKEKDADVNVPALDSLCMELRRQVEAYAAKERESGGAVKGTQTVIITRFQKAVCPNVTKDTTYEQDIIIQGKHFKNKIHVKASSHGGKASLKVDAPALVIPFVSETVKVEAKPSNEPGWFQKIGSNIMLFIAGVVVGAIAVFVIGLIKKIVTIRK